MCFKYEISKSLPGKAHDQSLLIASNQKNTHSVEENVHCCCLESKMLQLEQEDEERVHTLLATLVIVFSIPLLFIEVPISKTLASWSILGPLVPARLAWFIFELPNLVWPVICCSGTTLPLTNAILLGLFILHYVRRTILFPITMNTTSKGYPLVPMVFALLYTSVNGYLQSSASCKIAVYPDDHLLKPQSIVGLLCFAYGMYVNIQGDRHLQALKAQNKGYQIPRGGWFDLVSAAHYSGEVLEWTGYAFVATHLAAISFAVFTAGNLIPRGVAQHRWYRANFKDYPLQRKAIIPFCY